MPLDEIAFHAAPPKPFPALAAPARAATLARIYEGRSAETLLEDALTIDFAPGRLALVSSFGADSAVLLHMVSRIDRDAPVLFLETGMLFAETLAYQQELSAALGLRDVRLIRPDAGEAAAEDPDGALNARFADRCCDLRKTRPLETALSGAGGPLSGFDGWITGRKRAQSTARAEMPLVEADAAGRIKLNPLAGWRASDLAAYARAHDLPPHPLVAKGFPSIGCAPCTTAVRPGEDPRAGRWRGSEKVECGIHIVDGKIVRTAAGA